LTVRLRHSLTGRFRPSSVPPFLSKLLMYVENFVRFL